MNLKTWVITPRAAVLLVIGLVVVNVLSFVWYHADEGWRVLLLPVLSLLFAWNLFSGSNRIDALRRDVGDIFEKGDELRKTDPAAAQRLVDSHFAEKDRLLQRERAKQWELASHDRGAAQHLERFLQEELRTRAAHRKRLISTAGLERREAVAAWVDRMQRQTQEDLERVQALLEKLRLPS